MATTLTRRLSPYFERTKVAIGDETQVQVELKQNVPCLCCKKDVSIQEQSFSCEACEIASYCSATCRTKDKRFHK